MRKKLFLFLFMLFFIGINSVNAATTGDYNYNDTTYCYKADGTFVKVGKATFKKGNKEVGVGAVADNITTNCNTVYNTIHKTINGQTAYCAQAALGMLTGKNKTCTLVDSYNNNYAWTNGNWTERNALIVGDAMSSFISNSKLSTGQETVYIHSMLSQVLRFDSAHPTQKLISDIQNVINASTAKKYERAISGNAVNAKFQSNILDTVGVSYSKGVLNVTLTNTSVDTTMDVTASCSNCKIYLDSAYKTVFTKETVAKAANSSTPATKTLTLYVKTNAMYKAGTSVDVNFTASSRWTYPIGRLWYCGSGKQSVITLDSQTYSGSKKFSASAVSAGPNPTCAAENGKYYGKNGEIVTQQQYEAQCLHTCSYTDGKYYGSNGTEVTQQEYQTQCMPKCSYSNGNYYGSDGSIVTQEQYNEQCLHICSYYNGKYYGKEGTVITQDEYKNECGCERRDGKYYDDNGNEVTQAVYNQKCGRTVVFFKKDVYGNLLKGANVNLLLGNNGNDGSCSTNGSTSCRAYFSKDISSLTYKIQEAKSPDGYINSPDISNNLNLRSSQNTCYKNKITNEEKSWVSTDLSDCETVYANELVCYDNENNVWKQDITTEEACKSPAPTDTGGDNSGGDNTGDDGDNSGGEGVGTITNKFNKTIFPRLMEDPVDDNTGGDTGSEGGSGGDTSGSDTQGTVYENKWTWGSKCINKTTNTLATDVVETVGTGEDAVKYTKCDYDYVRVTSNGDVYYLEMTNTLNSIGFGKVDSSGLMISGAHLKVCTEAEYNKSKIDCTAYQPVGAGEGESVSWFSSNSVSVFNGFAVGKYYLVEDFSASGYKLNSKSVGFSVDKDGNVALLDSKNGFLRKESESSNISVVEIENDITKLSISKADISTKKEVPGAQLSICYSYDANEDENGKKADYQIALDNAGECIPVVLSDGTEATWTSTDKSHDVVGLPVGTYFLVEKLAPGGYSTAESILFTLKSDGSLVDKDGKSLANNKIVMYDKKINDVKTGMLGLYITFCIIVFAAVGGASSYFLLKKNRVNEI